MAQRTLVVRQVRVGDDGGTAGGYADTRDVHRHGHTVCSSALKTGNSGKSPAAQRLPQHDISALRKERQFIHIVEVQHVRAVDAREAVIGPPVVIVLNGSRIEIDDAAELAIVECLGESVTGAERYALTQAPADRHLKSVIVGIVTVVDQVHLAVTEIRS